MDIELRHLRYFAAISECGNFSRAAEALHISQPALSAQIKQLETKLATRLFDRVGRQVRITDAGEVLLSYARRMLSEIEEATEAINELEGLATGRLAVGVVQTVNGYLIPRVTNLFLAKHPGIFLKILELSATEVQQGVVSGQLALGISFIPSEIEAVEEQALFSERLVIVASQNHPLGSHRLVSVRSLAKERLVTFPEGFWTRRLTDELFASVAIKPRFALETNTIQGILAAVRNSEMVTILPELALHLKESKDLSMVNIKESAATRTLGCLWRKGPTKKRSALAFAGLLRDAISDNKTKPGK